MTNNSEMVLNFLKAHFGEEFTKADIAAALGISIPAVTGSVNFLVKNELATERMEDVEVEPATETRKAKVKTIRYEKLTEAGLNYDPVAAEAAKLAEKEAKKAAKKAAKAE